MEEIKDKIPEVENIQPEEEPKIKNRKYKVTFSTLGKYNNVIRTILVESLSASDAADLVWGSFGGTKSIDIENVEETTEEIKKKGR